MISRIAHNEFIHGTLRKINRKLPPRIASAFYNLARNRNTNYETNEYTRGKLLRTNTRPAFFEMAFSTIKSNNTGGDYLEFGVKFGSGIHIAHDTATKLGLQNIRFFAFDSFQGYPHTETEFLTLGERNASRKDFTDYIATRGVDLDRIVIVEGWFDDTLKKDTHLKPNHKLNQASLIHIDCDLYDSTVSVLDFIYDLIVPGTIIVFGDWYIHDRQEGPEAAEQLGYKKALNESILKSKLRDYYDSDSMKAFIVVE